MRYQAVYILAVCFLFLIGCEIKPEKARRHLQTAKVFVVSDPVDSTEILRKRFLTQHSDSSYIEYVFKGYDLVDIRTMDSSIRVDLRYADTVNFLRKNLYDGLTRAYFNCETAIKICAAQYYLKKIRPSYSLVVLDASRPQHIQQIMWDSLKMTPFKKFNYLAPPDETSMHNYGCAVDATIYDHETGKHLDMGTDYDFFDKLAQPVFEAHFLKTGDLSRKAFENRKLLRQVMKLAKMNPINSEWWHFSSVSKDEAIKRFPLIK